MLFGESSPRIAICKRMKLDPYLTPYKKINSKWIKDLKVRANTRKLLEEDVTVNLGDLGFDNGFYMTSKAQTITATDKWDFVNIEMFCASKDTTKNEKTIRRVGENICKYKELLSRIC